MQGNKLIEEVVLGAAKQLENAVDDEISRLDNLGGDDLESIRQRRLADLKRRAEQRAVWQHNGHGTLREIKEREFFGRAKASQRVLVVFRRRGHARLAQDFVDTVARLAERHEETLFAVIDAEDAPFLTGKFKIRVLPSAVFVKDGELRKVFHGLSELDHTGKFDVARLEQTFFRFEIVTDTNIADDN